MNDKVCVNTMSSGDYMNIIKLNGYNTCAIFCYLQERPEKPDEAWLTLPTWNAAYDLHETLPAFKTIHRDLLLTPCWIQMGSQTVSSIIVVEFKLKTTDL